MITTTLETQFGDAVDKIRTEGVHVALNVMTCCRGCTGHEDLGMEEGHTLYAYSFGGQGNELIWEYGKPFFREEQEEAECYCESEEWDEDEEGNEVLVSEEYTCGACNGYDVPDRKVTETSYQYFYFGDIEAGKTIDRVFKEHGFSTVWDGTTDDAIKVLF